MSMSQPSNFEHGHMLREQLRLFAFDTSSSPQPDFLLRIEHELSKRERLATLLEGELNFHGENSGYASHDLHAFAAKFPPQLPRTFIRGLTKPGDIVLDPMMGSGTTVVEALIEDRIGVGLDIDPLAIRLSRVKTLPLETNDLKETGLKVVSRALSLLNDGNTIEQYLTKQFDERTKSFIDYWFKSATQRELAALVLAINEVENLISRRFLELTFSSIIVTKSGGVSRARDLAHTRPHLDEDKVPKNAIEQFSMRFRRNLSSIAELKSMNNFVTTISGDARIMPFKDNMMDLIVTSPPYANAIDYMRAHKFSLVWFGRSINELSELRSKYIGSERVGNSIYTGLPDRPENIICQLASYDDSKAAVLRKYFAEMNSAISEMYRVLRPDAACIIVVGTSMMRGIDVETHYCLADIASEIGFDVVGIAKRILDRNKRMMPARFGKKGDSMIEQRMHDEYVIGLLKPFSV